MYNDMLNTIDFVGGYDKEVADIMNLELTRQQENIELIASENFVSPAVMAAMGSVLTNKYAEGYPGKRYYGGCQHVDIVESIAIKRACELFGADHANVQPHSGAQANMAAYFAFLKPGDTVLGMNLAHGGHLTHGAKFNASGALYNFIGYSLGDDEFINYDEIANLAKEHSPKMIVAGASSHPRAIDFEKISKIAKSVNAIFMVDMAHIAGLVAAGLHQSPIPHADVVTTTTHKTLRGPRGGMILCKAEHQPAIDKAVFPGMQGGPLMHVIAAKAVCFKEAATAEFKTYQQRVIANAAALANGLKSRGMKLVSNGTDNHIVLLSLVDLGLTGKELEHRLDEVNITTNKNAIPNDPEKPFITSGIRLGTPAATTRGLNEEDFDKIADCIHLAATDFESSKEKIRAAIKEICAKYPLYN